MWVWFSRRFRLWLLMAVGAPVVGWFLGKVGDRVEMRAGHETSLSRNMHRGRAWVRRHERGPLAGRRRDVPPPPA